jgi:hypothetical protein
MKGKHASAHQSTGVVGVAQESGVPAAGAVAAPVGGRGLPLVLVFELVQARPLPSSDGPAPFLGGPAAHATAGRAAGAAAATAAY